MRRFEAGNRKHDTDNKYYRSFAPFVTTVSGAVSQASAELMRVLKAVARGHRNVLDWEPARWMEDILHRVAVEMVKTVAVMTSRVVLPPHIPPHGHCCDRAVPRHALRCRASCRML